MPLILVPDEGPDLGTTDLDAFARSGRGVIEVDGRGVIVSYNRAEARMSGRVPARMIGRNFFLDVAPCTDVPSFHGRFREGVAAGRLDVTLEFVYAFHMEPVRAEIRLLGPIGPDRYAIVSRVIARIEADARDAEPVADPADAGDACAREPIRTAGAIQPHGTLLVTDAEAGRILSVAANVSTFLGVGPRDLTDRDLGAALPGDVVATIRSALPDLRPTPPLKLDLSLGGRTFDVCVHRADDRVIVELEPRPPTADLPPICDARNLIPHAVARLRTDQGVDLLAQDVVRIVRNATGFDRVLIYRFGPDWHGEVIAEAKAPDWAVSLIGLRFPAMEIPAQARALYTVDHARQMPDARYVPVPLEPASDPRDGRPFDLGHARLRSASPKHREYQAHLGVVGSFSVSLVVDDQLWGLLIGHHRGPRRLSADQLDAVAQIAEVAAPRLVSGLRRDVRQRRDGLREVQARFVETARARGANVPLTDLADPGLADLFDGCCGAGTAIQGRWAGLGDVPPEDVVDAVLAFARGRDERGVWTSDRLATEVPAVATAGTPVAGALVIFPDVDRRDALIWFRPEEVRHVAWAGDPRGRIASDGTPTPRRSFARWIEARRGLSRPWARWEADLAREFRVALNELTAASARRIAELNLQLQLADAARSRFVATMSHELRTPLNAILGFSDLLGSGIAGRLSPKQAEYANDIHAAGRHLLDLVDDVLDLSRMDAGALKLQEERLEVADLVADALMYARPMAAARSVSLGVSSGSDLPDLLADRRAVRQILVNLLSNALKFTPAGGEVTVEARATADGVRIAVVDTGVGIPPEMLPEVIHPFVQVEGPYARTRQGAGLGLAIVQRLADAHGARFDLTSQVGRGTRAEVVFPPARLLPVTERRPERHRRDRAG